MSIIHIINPKEKNLGDFSVRRLLPFARQTMVGPWIFFDHAGPASFEPGKGIDVRPHPHINLATVTYLFEGEILHRDSLGSMQTIHPGDINLMVAGKGITHSERETDAVRNSKHTLHALQLWHVLPEEDEEIEPSFYHYNKKEIPGFTVNNVSIRLIMGSAYGHISPVKTFARTLYLEADLKENDILDLPHEEELGIYVISGSISLEDSIIEQYSMVTLNNEEPNNNNTKIKASKNTRIAIIGGEKMSKRYIEWNFVSSRKERIEQAKEDWKAQKFPKVIGDEVDFIPLPD